MKYVAPKLGVRFMNLGYWPSIEPQDDKLNEFLIENDLSEYDADKAHVYLYEKALSLHPNYPSFQGLEILEVSCGQGNSIDLIQKWHGPARCVIGCDKVMTRNARNIVYGDAANLPFANESFDFVLNVEASHLYANFPKFISECSRVLKPNGVFCWLDVRYPHEVGSVKLTAATAGLKLKRWEDITKEVVVGLNHTAKKYDTILERAPFFVKLFKTSLRATYCAPGTSTYERLQKGQRVYLAAMWMKKANEQ
ncbi:unnamed protein product [Caenorhabditis sp. 36 PRJEB53466]|nr:unnamed protein product [Caenorhabditis sp. 36 PRJEB53466]